MSLPVTGGRMSATLCLPDGPTDRIMLLMPGASVNHWYWDATGGFPATYNFRRAMNDAGYATLVVDRFANGESDRPPSVALTSPGQAGDLHEIVGMLRRGLPGATPFAKVILGGVSLSSGIAAMEAATFHDVDGVLLTGFSHEPDFPRTLRVVADVFHPAEADPKFRGRGYDPGYWTVAPGDLTAAHFLGPGTDPAVAQALEANRDVFTWSEFMTGMTSTILETTQQISAPVMVANGSLDQLCVATACATTDSLRAAEEPHFSPPARLHTYVLPGAGHAINLAPNAAEYRQEVIRWAATI